MPRYRIFALALGLFVLLAAASNAGAVCRMGQVAEVPLHVKGGRLYIDIRVNGQATEALLSTESQQSSVAGWALPKFGLKQQSTDALMVGIKGMGTAYVAEVERIQLGALTVAKTPLWVSGHREAAPTTDPIVLGGTFFAQTDVEFDVQHHALRLFRPEGCSGDEVLYWGGAFSVTPLLSNPDGWDELLVETKLNGMAVRTLLASGERYTVVSAATASRVGSHPLSPSPEALDTGILLVTPKTFDSFTLDQEAMKNVTLGVATRKQFYTSGLNTRLNTNFSLPAMSLGADFFTAHRIMIANSQHQLYFTYAGGPAFALPTTEP